MCGIIGVIIDHAHALPVKPRVLHSNASVSAPANPRKTTAVSHPVQWALSSAHRGQDAWGTAIQHVRQHTADSCPEVYIDVQKHMGLVRPNKVEAPTASCVSIHDSADLLPTIAGIGHVRYPTNTEFSNHSSQPFVSKCGRIALCHNGNISNYATSSSPTVPWPRV